MGFISNTDNEDEECYCGILSMHSFHIRIEWAERLEQYENKLHSSAYQRNSMTLTEKSERIFTFTIKHVTKMML